MNPERIDIQDDHTWVRRRLAAAANGLLDDGDTERFEDHVSGCVECGTAWREQLDALLEGPDEDPRGERHLTPALIARWDSAGRGLSGAEREAVHRHLARCAACRGDLDALGHDPELAPVTIGGRADARPAGKPRSFLAGLAWGFGATALAAAAAVLIWMPGPGTEGSAVLPWVAPVNLRGGRTAELELAPGMEAFTVLVGIPAGLDPLRPATVTVFGPDGGILVAADVTARMHELRTVSILIRSPGGVPEGEYRVVFSQPTSEGPGEDRTSTFRVVRPGG